MTFNDARRNASPSEYVLEADPEARDVDEELGMAENCGDPVYPVAAVTRQVRASLGADTAPTKGERHPPFKVRYNYVVCDSDWEAEFCRVAEGHPRVRAYVKNQGLGLEVPYLVGAEPHRYIPDFIVLVDDGRGDDDLLHLVVEIKGYRSEDAKVKKSTMDTYWP